MATMQELRLQFEKEFGMKAPSRMTKAQLEHKLNNVDTFNVQDQAFHQALTKS